MTMPVLLREPGCVEFEPTWRAMQALTDRRDGDTRDEIWFLQHPPVFTLGLNGDPAHVLGAGQIPVVNTDRGGQVTYHGPGQLVVYPLLDLRRLGLGVRSLVTALEQSVIELLAGWDIEAVARADAPGVYVAGAKIASIGLRVRRGASYHGLALNIDLDLAPFARINPCGFAALPMTRLCDLHAGATVASVLPRYRDVLLGVLGLEGELAAQPSQLPAWTPGDPEAVRS